jgi:Flp pilus assembly protein TadG
LNQLLRFIISISVYSTDEGPDTIISVFFTICAFSINHTVVTAGGNPMNSTMNLANDPKTQLFHGHFLRRENGQSMVMFAIALVAILGCCALCFDVGVMAIAKSDLQISADAAALAGAQELPDDPTEAVALARSYAEKNGVPADEVVVTISDDARAITVEIGRTSATQFARIFDVASTRAKAKATARIGIAASVPWIVPFVIPEPAVCDYDHVYVMRMYGAGPYSRYYQYPSDYRGKYPSWPKNDPYPWHFDYMNVKIKPGSNPSIEFQDYLSYLRNGFRETFKVGQDMLYYAPSSGGRESVNTFSSRIEADSNTDHTKAKVGDARVMLIPVVENLLPRNTRENTKVEIIGFVGVFLQKVYKNSYGETFWFEGRFLKDLNVGTGEVTYDTDADFGLRVIGLVE